MTMTKPSPESDLRAMIQIAEMIVARKDPHIPVQTLIKSLAVTVLLLRDKLDETKGTIQ